MRRVVSRKPYHSCACSACPRDPGRAAPAKIR
jgi:hypothetical protein